MRAVFVPENKKISGKTFENFKFALSISSAIGDNLNQPKKMGSRPFSDYPHF
jgi:hypothetical protein